MTVTYIQLGLFDHRDDVNIELGMRVHRWKQTSTIPVQFYRTDEHTLPLKVYPSVELLLSGARTLAVVVDGFGYMAHRSHGEVDDYLFISKYDLSLGMRIPYEYESNIEATNETLLAIAPYEAWIAISHCFFPFSNENDAKKWNEKHLTNEAAE